MMRKSIKDVIANDLSKQQFWDIVAAYMNLRFWDVYIITQCMPAYSEDLGPLSNPLKEAIVRKWLEQKQLPDLEKVTVLEVVNAITENKYYYSDLSSVEALLLEMTIIHPFSMELAGIETQLGKQLDK